MTQLSPVSIGQKIALHIKRLGINGEGLAFFNKLIIFVPGALPKEKVSVEITKITPKYAEATLVKIITSSPNRIAAPCPIYDTCGGCQLQHLNYPAQLEYKRDLLRQALHKFKPANYENYRLLPAIGMDEPWHYRNKAQFQVRTENARAIAGLYQTNSHKLVEVTDCLVQIPITQKIINFAMDKINEFHVPIYDEASNSGILKTLMVRTGVETGEVQLVFITHTKKLPKINPVIRAITAEFPEVVSFMQNIQADKSSKIFGDETFLLAGKETIDEKLATVSFELSARAFFQLNPSQTVKLYDQARLALDLQQNETLIDAYCGVGTIGLSLAHIAYKVYGMDIVPESIADARKNAEAMHLNNTHYEVGSAETLIPKWYEDGFMPDAIVVDPPRTGLDEALLQTLISFPPKKLVYVSCNVSTLARDLKQLSKRFNVEYLQSIDMFPQTARCEVVVKLTKK